MAKKVNMKKSLFTLIIAACLSTVPLSASAITTTPVDIKKDAVSVSGIDNDYTYRNTFDTPTTLNRAFSDRTSKNASDISDMLIRDNPRDYGGATRNRLSGDVSNVLDTTPRRERYNYRRNAFGETVGAPTTYRYRTSDNYSGMGRTGLGLESEANTMQFSTANTNPISDTMTTPNTAMSMNSPASPSNFSTFGNNMATVPNPSMMTTSPTGMTTASPTGMTTTPAGMANTTAGAPSTSASDIGTASRSVNRSANITTPTANTNTVNIADRSSINYNANSNLLAPATRPNATTIYNIPSTVGGTSRSGITSRYYNPMTREANVRVPSVRRSAGTENTRIANNTGAPAATQATVQNTTANTTVKRSANKRYQRTTPAVNTAQKNIAPAASRNRNTPSAPATVTKSTVNRAAKTNIANHTRAKNANLPVNANTKPTVKTNRAATTHTNTKTHINAAVPAKTTATRSAVAKKTNTATTNKNTAQTTTAYRNTVNNTRGYRNTANTATTATAPTNSIYEHYEYTAHYPADSEHAKDSMSNGGFRNFKNSNNNNTMTDTYNRSARNNITDGQHAQQRSAEHSNANINTNNRVNNNDRNSMSDGTYRDYMTDGVYRNTNIAPHNATANRNTNTYSTTDTTSNRNRATRSNRNTDVKGGLYRNDSADKYSTTTHNAKRTTMPATPATVRNTRTARTGTAYRAVNPARTTVPSRTTRVTAPVNPRNNMRATPARTTRAADTTTTTSTTTFIILIVAIVLLLGLAIFALMRPRKTDSDNEAASRRR